jgi:Fe-S-cluster containining protein
MSRAEYLRLKRYLASLPSADRARVLSQNKRLPWPGAPSITYVACPFRDVELGRCAVYPARPLVCRLFGHVEWLPCPSGKVSSPAASGVRLFQRYSELELKTFPEWEEIDGAPGS